MAFPVPPIVGILDPPGWTATQPTLLFLVSPFFPSVPSDMFPTPCYRNFAVSGFRNPQDLK